MNPVHEFEVFCLERYRAVNNLTGLEALALFENKKILDYLSQNYEVLHTQGERYLLREIQEIIEQ